jgi:Tfp pilus assembly protein PilO
MQWWRLDACGLAGILLLTLLAYFAILRPLGNDRAELGALRTETEEAQSRLVAIESAASRRSDDLARTEQMLNASRVNLQTVDQLNRRLAVIVEEASGSGLSIHESVAGDARSGKRHETVPVDLSGKGSYESCAEFLHRVYENLPDVEVLSIELTGRPGTRGAHASFRFELAWYAAPMVARAE